MTTLLGVVVNDSGLPILPIGNPAGSNAFFRLFFETETGKKLAPLMSARAEIRIQEVVERWFPNDPEITIEKLSRVVENLLAVRDPALFPPAPEPVQDTRPRRADGTFIGEFEIWASARHRSMKEIRDRADRDATFREWFHTTTVAQTIQDGGLRIAGTPSRMATPTDHALLGEFVRLFRVTPTARLKPLGGFITIDQDHRYSVEDFNALIDRASAAGLL